MSHRPDHCDVIGRLESRRLEFFKNILVFCRHKFSNGIFTIAVTQSIAMTQASGPMTSDQ
ncbi:LdOrf-31 peptide [Lymantria dispar multiple nucleopolyhedrovirus]|uniref:LdOrf-31 peptide n=1 Tax=Lymantria dispar multicapsid nuclear polyhedrosis virus TaxID=10449 RepID=Q9YMU3_NPVLD|nr:LdOrf-31 peptide [Lymantria dispar multiple nucleopolyhedrovirus]AAC70216.1 LdOrf-31 peptide [Lymantria dispar multiple nucleopolyhedrovirus]